MEFRNFTPFPALAYQAIDQRRAQYHVVALRQTLVWGENRAVTYAKHQEGLAVADDYFGDINRSSVRQESDLVPFKPLCDVIVIATGYAPAGAPVPQFDVTVRVNATSGPQRDRAILEKNLRVTGPRVWQEGKGGRRWVLSEPEPITSLPIRYEYAYGGEQRLDTGDDTRHTVAETNPVGLGFSEKWFREAVKAERVPAAQIEDPRDPVGALGKSHAAKGFGVITKAWLPRRAFAGTADDAFAKSDRWLPEDFDFKFWNGAHPDLQVPYLNGDEVVELTNLTPGGHLRLALPGDWPYVLVRYEDGEIQATPISLDTLIIDCERGTVATVHRLRLPVDREVRVLEARLVTRSEWDAALAADSGSRISNERDAVQDEAVVGM